MDRNQIKNNIQRMYQARLENNAAACKEFFTADARFALLGEDESVYQSPSTAPTDVGEQIEALVAAWHWKQVSDQRILIDGSNAAVFYRLKTVFNPSGDEIETQISDHIVMSEDGLIAEFNEFVDTALVKSLAAKV